MADDAIQSGEGDDLQARARQALERTTRPVAEGGKEPVDADFLALLTVALEAMPKRRRAIFLAHRIDGLSYREIARATSLSVRAIESHMAMAIAYLDHVVRHRELPPVRRWWRWWGR